MSSDRQVAHRARELGPVTRQVAPLIIAALAVQVLLPFRSDNAAHVLGGGALTMLPTAMLPGGWLRVPWSEAAILVGVLAVAYTTEWTVFGPFDIVDAAFTMSGALVVLAAFPECVVADRRERSRLAVTALLLGAASLAHRYLTGIGVA